MRAPPPAPLWTARDESLRATVLLRDEGDAPPPPPPREGCCGLRADSGGESDDGCPLPPLPPALSSSGSTYWSDNGDDILRRWRNPFRGLRECGGHRCSAKRREKGRGEVYPQPTHNQRTSIPENALFFLIPTGRWLIGDGGLNCSRACKMSWATDVGVITTFALLLFLLFPPCVQRWYGFTPSLPSVDLLFFSLIG